MGRREFISVGNDFDTPDGTSVRDYIHVMDLAEGHLKALKRLQEKPKHYAVYNLGIGRGISVREMIDVSARVDDDVDDDDDTHMLYMCVCVEVFTKNVKKKSILYMCVCRVYRISISLYLSISLHDIYDCN
jgi:nucleoside-diphosphate-sugar epimerase